MITIIILCIAITSAQAVKMQIYNQCPFKIWPGVQGNPLVAGGGFEMNPYQTYDLNVPDGWRSARIWARTGCNGNMECETGFCGNDIRCSGRGGRPPVTLVEFTLNGDGGQDYYDVSLVDGYNLVVSVEPIAGTYEGQRGGTWCQKAGMCDGDVNPKCPANLAVKNSNGYTVACFSDCMKYNTDETCCRGAFNDPNRCKASASARLFKQHCPMSYSYAYDDKNNSLFFCRGSGGRKSPDYRIVFCA